MVTIRGARHGENIYPREIEEYLFGFENVQEVHVVGVPDEKFGEAVCACISLSPGIDACEEEIMQFCRERIAHYKVPRYVRFVDSFPMTVTGKVQKHLLRDRMRHELGL